MARGIDRRADRIRQALVSLPRFGLARLGLGVDAPGRARNTRKPIREAGGAQPDVDGRTLNPRRSGTRRTLIPGLIDLHIHGAGGADVLDGTPDAIETMARTLARLGTTSFLATTFLRPEIGSRHIAGAGESVGRTSGGANVLGLHLEGPTNR